MSRPNNIIHSIEAVHVYLQYKGKLENWQSQEGPHRGNAEGI